MCRTGCFRLWTMQWLRRPCHQIISEQLFSIHENVHKMICVNTWWPRRYLCAHDSKKWQWRLISIFNFQISNFVLNNQNDTSLYLFNVDGNSRETPIIHRHRKGLPLFFQQYPPTRQLALCDGNYKRTSQFVHLQRRTCLYWHQNSPEFSAYRAPGHG